MYLPTLVLNSKINIFKNRQEHLTQYLSPEAEIKHLNPLLQDLKQDLNSKRLVFRVFIHWQVCQVRKNWEPKTLLRA